jgi:hypothetical protein
MSPSWAGWFYQTIHTVIPACAGMTVFSVTGSRRTKDQYTGSSQDLIV